MSVKDTLEIQTQVEELIYKGMIRESLSPRALFLSETRVERSINKGKTVFALFVLEKGEGETPLRPLAQPLVQEF